METLGTTLRYEMMILLVVLIVLVGYKLMVRQINTDGLMLDKTSGRSFSPARLQMLAVTMTIALYYMLLVFEAEDTGRLPDLPNELLLALGGSHIIYLGGKLYGMFAARFGLASPRIKLREKPTERRMKR